MDTFSDRFLVASLQFSVNVYGLNSSYNDFFYHCLTRAETDILIVGTLLNSLLSFGDAVALVKVQLLIDMTNVLQLMENLNAEVGPDEANPHVLRVGWSTDNNNLLLGMSEHHFIISILLHPYVVL